MRARITKTNIAPERRKTHVTHIAKVLATVRRDDEHTEDCGEYEKDGENICGTCSRANGSWSDANVLPKNSDPKHAHKHSRHNKRS